MRRLRWATLIAGFACLLGVGVTLVGTQPSHSSAADAPATPAPMATAAAQSAQWRPTYEAMTTCNHLPPPTVAQVIVPDIAGMTEVNARCALIRAGVRGQIDEVGYTRLPTDAPPVGEYRIFAVASGPQAHRQNQRLTPGAAVVPDAPLTIMLYAPRA